MEGFNPRQFERESECVDHGAFTEPGYSIFGSLERAHWGGCPTCNEIKRKQEEAEKAEAEQRRKQEILGSRLREAGIPKAYIGKGFGCYKAESESQKQALEITREYASRFWDEYVHNGRSLVLAGSVGTGKSHLALAIAQHVMKRGTVIYSDVMSIIRSIRNTWSRNSELTESQVFDMYTDDCTLLVIDEVGVQRGTEDEQMLIFDIINRRYREEQPMILITNLGGEAFKSFLGERSFNRLEERAAFVPFFWESYRSIKQ